MPRKSEGKVILGTRDVDLLISVCELRYLSSSQVQRLHFPSLQTANRRLRLLEHERYVRRFRGPGVDEDIVMLTEKGAAVVAERLDVPLEQLPWKRKRSTPKNPYFLAHFLAITDFRLDLVEAADRLADVSLLGFIPEYRGTKTNRGGMEKYIRDSLPLRHGIGRISHTPDGVFALVRSERKALFFLEVDRGTETLADSTHGFLKTISFYLNFVIGKRYQRYQKDFKTEEPFRAFRVLVATSSTKRLENIRRLGGDINFSPAHAKRFIWLAEIDKINLENMFSPIWVSLDPNDAQQYAIVPSLS
jgi:hypothetical protein